MDEFVSTIKDIYQNPTSRYILAAASFRFFGGYAIGFFKPQYFQAVYPEFTSQFSVTNAALASVLGFTSALTGGILADKFRKDDPMTKSYICIASSLLASPAIAAAFLLQDDFWVSISLLGVNYLFAEATGSPSITMLLDTTSPKNPGLTVAVYLLFATLAGTLSTTLLDALNTYLGAADHVETYGYTLAGFTLFSYLGSVPFFYLAGKSYTEFQNEKEKK